MLWGLPRHGTAVWVVRNVIDRLLYSCPAGSVTHFTLTWPLCGL